MENKTDLNWKPKTWRCPKCHAEIGNDYKQCPACWAGPLPIKEIKEVLFNYYKEKKDQSNRNY
jgi:predicted amidophosphoribosyltransferase